MQDMVLKMAQFAQQAGQQAQQGMGHLQAQIAGMAAAQILLWEILFHVCPEQRQAVIEVLGQVLARPESTPNPHQREFLQEVYKIARQPSRLTPEGRRGWLHLASDNAPQP